MSQLASCVHLILLCWYSTAPRRRPFYLGIYRFCRALIRRRQEASATRDVRQSAEAAVMGAKMECTKLSRQHSEEKQRHDRKVAELESTIDDLHEKVLHREEQIRILRELDIEKLNRQIGVLEAENEYLAACHERELNLKRAEIAVSNASPPEVSIARRCWSA